MQTYRDEIVNTLNSCIILRYAYQRGVEERTAFDDDEVRQAVELLLDKERYVSILHPEVAE
jgi:ABC-type oligopeptide transport system substrate-binding subunit